MEVVYKAIVENGTNRVVEEEIITPSEVSFECRPGYHIEIKYIIISPSGIAHFKLTEDMWIKAEEDFIAQTTNL